jgi:RNA polymerase sigma-70 factor (ECF subfamily)
VSGADAIDAALAEARPRLVALAYRMVGSVADAEDIVQDAALRARAAAPDDLRSPVAYLTTATTRAAIDHLRSARVRREAYVGPWLPEPLAGDPAPDVSAAAELSDSLSMAFLVLLEALSPDERAVLLLHDVFGHTHAEVAEALGRTPASSRQLLRRARQHVEAGRPRQPVDTARRDALVRRFAAVCEGGDLEDLLALLTDDAVYVADGGAAAKAARRPIVGAARVGRFLAWVSNRYRPSSEYRVVRLNEEPAVAWLVDGRLSSVMFVELDGDRIARIHSIRNPDKLRSAQATLEGVERHEALGG